MTTYKLTKFNGVIRIADNAFIPFDPANTDYQEYLKWLEAGNEPIPANAGEGNEPLPAETPEQTNAS